MSNGTSKPRRALQLGSALVAIAALVASITSIASAQDTQTRYYSGVITGRDFCTNNSLGDPQTFPFDQDRDGVADICSLPRTRRATVARQNAMELLALDFPARFGQLFAYECPSVAESYGNPEKEAQDECAAPRAAAAAGQAIPSVPASRVSPVINTTWPSSFFTGPVVTSSTFCLNRSLGGPVTYPLDTNGDAVADICSLPTTRRATIARQNALERLAAERSSFFEPLFTSECARLIDSSFGEATAEARDECADRAANTGQPLPGSDGGSSGSTGGSNGGSNGGSSGSTGGSTGGTSGSGNTGNTGTPTGPTRSVSAPKATKPGPYSKRAAQDMQLAPSDKQITVSWKAVAVEDDGETPVVDSDIYDSGEVFEYVIAYSTSSSMSNSRQQAVNRSGSEITDLPEWTCSFSDPTYSCTIKRLSNFTTYYVRVLANRGKSNSTGSGTNANSDYWTPVLSITPGIAGPPMWIDKDVNEDGVQGLVAEDYGEMRAFWQAPVGDAPSNYTLQWGTNQSFANNCDNSSSCEQKTVTSPPAGGELIEGLSNNRTYYVRVQGATANGPGTWSLVQSLRLASTDPNPGKPANVRLTSADSGTSLDVSWDAPAVNDNDPEATSYRVQWRNVSDNENWDSLRRQESPTARSLKIDRLDTLDRYQVRVLAVRNRVAGPWSDTEEIILGRPGTPSIASIAPGSHSLTVSWSAPASSPAVNSIVIQWDTSSGFASNCVADTSCNERSLTPATSGSEELTGLNSNTVYYVRMRSISSNGFSTWSERHSGEPGTLDAPSDVMATENTGNIRSLDLSWTSETETDKPDLSGFAVRYRRIGTTSWSSVNLSDFDDRDDETYNCNSGDIDGDLTDTSFACTLTGLVSGTPYEVQVLAKNSYGNGPWSTTASTSPTNVATPGSSFIPEITSISQVTDSSDRQTLQVIWSAPSNPDSLEINSYYVQWRTCGTSGYSCGGWGTSSTIRPDANELLATSSQYPATSLRDGTVYIQARVRANGTSANGGNGGFGDSSRYEVTIDDNDEPSDRDMWTVTVTGTTIP